MDNVIDSSSSEKLDYTTAKTTLITENEILILKLLPKSFNDINIIKDHNNEFIDADIESANKTIVKTFENDRFKKYTGKLEAEFEISQIYPAIEKDIDKFSYHPKYNSIETWNDYDTKTRIIASEQNVDWINNILDHKSEADRILYEDEDFVFIYDYKCDKKDINNFYALIFFKGERIFSMRDLEFKHVELLSSIRSRVEDFMKSTFNIGSNKLRMYFHYPPSFWHLHIHVNLFDCNSPGINAEYCHLLHTVIQNLTINSDYYKKITIETLNR